MKIDTIKKIKRLDRYLCHYNGLYVVDFYREAIKNFLREEGQMCYEALDNFKYDVNNNNIIFRIQETPGSNWNDLVLDVNEKLLNITLQQMAQMAHKKAKEDYLNKIASIKVGEVLHGNSIIIEKL
jgi:hypothetical protein